MNNNISKISFMKKNISKIRFLVKNIKKFLPKTDIGSRVLLKTV